MSINIVSFNIGVPQTCADASGQNFVSAIRKQPYQASVALTAAGLHGDDTFEEVHGTPDRAMHVFCHEHYAFFADKAGYPLPPSVFGENLCITGMLESEACVGDIWQIGTAQVQVSMPTERCKTIGLSLGEPAMLKWIHEHMMTGYYVRVLQDGEVGPQSHITLLQRPHPEWSIDRLNQLLFKQRDRHQQQAASELAALSDEWVQRAWQLYERTGD